MDYYSMWLEEEKRAFEGWDFSYLDGRMIEESLPWDYREIVMDHLRPNEMLLDLGTGGGELLLTLGHPYDKTAVTEGYEPNYLLCKRKLEPLGIRVKRINEFDEYDMIPYDDDMFDIVINRHESSNITEINRVLKKGGYYITQQVGESNNVNLSKMLDCERIIYDNSNSANIQRLRENGFIIERHEEFYPKVEFKDIGALVYFAKIIEWEYQGFSVETHFDILLKLQKEIEESGPIVGNAHRFLIVARKPVYLNHIIFWRMYNEEVNY